MNTLSISEVGSGFQDSADAAHLFVQFVKVTVTVFDAPAVIANLHFNYVHLKNKTFLFANKHIIYIIFAITVKKKKSLHLLTSILKLEIQHVHFVV